MENQTIIMPGTIKSEIYIFNANTIQVNLLMNNVLSVIEQEKGHSIEVAIHPEVAFITNEDRKGF